MNSDNNVSSIIETLNNSMSQFEESDLSFKSLSQISRVYMSDLVNLTDKLNNNLPFNSASFCTESNSVVTGISMTSYFYVIISLLLSGEVFNKRRYLCSFNYCLCLLIDCLIKRLYFLHHWKHLCGIFLLLDVYSLTAAYTWIIIQGYCVYESVILTKQIPLFLFIVLGYVTPLSVMIAFYHLQIQMTPYSSCFKCSSNTSAADHHIWHFVLSIALVQLVSTVSLVYTLRSHWKNRLTQLFYRSWIIISTYFTVTLLYSSVDQYYYSTSWSSFLVASFDSLMGPLIFVLEILTNKQLLATLSITSYDSQSSLSSRKWSSDEINSHNEMAINANETKADNNGSNSSVSVDSSNIPLAHTGRHLYLEDDAREYIYI